jgi:hypothetical protein
MTLDMQGSSGPTKRQPTKSHDIRHRPINLTHALPLTPPHGVHLPGLPTAALCCTAPLATTFRVQAVSQRASSLHRRFPMRRAPTVRLAAGAMEVDSANEEYRSH